MESQGGPEHITHQKYTQDIRYTNEVSVEHILDLCLDNLRHFKVKSNQVVWSGFISENVEAETTFGVLKH